MTNPKPPALNRLEELNQLALEGGGAARIQQWDGELWKTVSDWVKADRALLRPLIDKKARDYAKEKGITPRDCGKS